jgi:hypothetical protein
MRRLMRTARSRTSWEYLPRFAMLASSQGMEPPANPGRFILYSAVSDSTTAKAK